MQVQPKKQWKRKPQGNKAFLNLKNPLRNFVERVLPSIPLEEYPDRPPQPINLSVGDPTTSPEYRTHKDNLEVLSECVGKVDGYTNVQGLDSARQAVVDTFKSKNHPLSKDDVYLTAGGSMALWSVISLLAGPGDNFLFPSPGFPLTLTIAKSMDIEPRFYHLQAGNKWQANLEEIQNLIDDRTKFILVNDPSNPLGSVWSIEHKREIIKLCIKRKIPILADEIYEEMSYDEPSPTFADLIEPAEIDKITVFKCSGLTKRYLAPGWRMGWIIVYGSTEVQQHCRPFLRGIFNVILMPTTIVQSALPGILKNQNNHKRIIECMDMMRENQRTLKKSLQGQKYCTFGHSSGALYATILIELRQFKQEEMKDMIQFAKQFYAQENVMIFPGDFFAAEVNFIRLVISCDLKRIEEFLIRFKRFCHRHLKQQ